MTAAPLARARLPRVVDLVLALTALVALAPLLLAVALAVRATSRGPVLFRQERVGLNGEPFMMLKFRSMYRSVSDTPHREYVTGLLNGAIDGAGPGGAYKLHRDPRVTPVGRFIRRYSLDELPQLLNVVRGEMSLVGPRPALPYEVPLYRSDHLRRFDVPPCITGLWQVSGRNKLTMTEMLDLDVEYVERKSLAVDLAILARTIPALLRKDGAR
jgi:lipopolysaccharide/colanic/teichoic acid biosynthesis glycosyltransferase